jgi:hypothetical protein
MEKLDVIKVTEYDFAVAVVVYDKSTSRKVRLVTVYGPAHDDKKDQFLIELSNICAQNDLPLILGGDFIILRSSDEKNKEFKANRFTYMFNWIINSYELGEIPLNGGKYTCSNNQADPTLERLDRVLMNSK